MNIDPHQNAEIKLQEMAEAYVNFEILGTRVPIPYVLGYGRWQFHKTSGKGSVEEIRNELKRRAATQSVDLKTLSAGQIFKFMKENKIGIDCSGLAYHLLNAYIFELTHQPLSDFIVRFGGTLGQFEKKFLQYKRQRRINAATLTSDNNSREIPKAAEIRIGDMVRIRKDLDHILVIAKLNLSNNQRIITYVHSSSTKHTKKQGPHYGTIEITQPEKGLEFQNWTEMTKDGSNYGQAFFTPELGDSVRRLIYV
ncbi:hypothetical protein KC571_02810 [candidate division WWE3 bacterium]|uniref:Uncharacterized protein n=1 Tax=candidate division WWE3 bacterium TaxID=2053526 RepID=A0A955RQA3_UNCKA|nr:hypothetical protein [candidate division WWE3 bacterium]